MLPKVNSTFLGYIRFSNWWQYKAAPLVGLFFLMAYVSGMEPAASLLVLGASVITIVGIAGLGYFINDLGDIEYDRRVHKTNRASRMSFGRKVLVTVVLLAVAFLPWLYLPDDIFSRMLIAFQFLLYIVYSLKPFRLKERGLAGIICDSLYGLTVPAALAVYTYHLIGNGSLQYFPAFFILLILLFAAKGFRNILLHQLEDRHNDKKSGVQTWVLNYGGGKTIRLINLVITPVELFLLLGWIAVASFSIPFFWISMIVFGAYHVLKIGMWGTLGVTRRHLRFKFLYALNDYYEAWLPLYSLGLLLSADWRFSVFIPVTIVLFPGTFVNILSGFSKIAENLKKLRRGDYGKWWSPRHGRFMYNKHYENNRFVMAACGGRKYIDRLHFSLNALQRFSRNEIIVVTDSSRNEIPIVWNNVVDVKIPSHLSNAQACLFLKTTINRHLPGQSRYCFLDPHVVALSAEVDEIFHHKMGPVTFAPDGKRLREFSPHAVNCGCIQQQDGREKLSPGILQRQREFFKKLENEKSGRLRYLLFLLRFKLSPNIFKLGSETFYNKQEHFWFSSSGLPFFYDKEVAAPCDHLRQMIAKKFGVSITDPDWHHWNSSVFLFDESSGKFLDRWHQKTMQIIGDAGWKTCDQGTLAATVWEMGLQKEFLLTKRFNFMADFHNGRLTVMDEACLSDDGGETQCRPAFINIRKFFGTPGWDVWDWVESKLALTA